MARRQHPRAAAWLLRSLLPSDQREAVLAELDDEYVRFVRPNRSWLAARAWYWRQACGSGLWSLAGRHRAHRQRRSRGWSVDVRDAVRALIRTPLFSATVIATLALGIGTTTTVFSVLDAVLLRPLPYPEPGQLVRLWPERTVSKSVMDTIMDEADAFERLAGFYVTSQALTDHGEPRELQGIFATPDHLRLLGAVPALGRLLAPDDVPAGDAVVVSHAAWSEIFGSRADVVGDRIMLGGHTRTVVGVLPETYRPLVDDTDFWLPMRIDTEDYSDYQGVAQVLMLGRLAPGESLDAAADNVRTVAMRIHDEFPTSYSEEWAATSRPVPLHHVMVRDARATLWTVMGAVFFLLLIVCANVANLLVSRGIGRQTELAIRAGLGATPWRIVRVRLLESLALSVSGGLAGIGVAWALLQLVRASLAGTLVLGDRVHLDGVVLAFAAVVSLLAGLAAGAGPALSALRATPTSLLRGAQRGASGRDSRARFSRLVVGAEVALAVVLVIGAGLLLRSARHLIQVDPGFVADQVTTLRVRFPDSGRLSEEATRARFLEELVGRLDVLPGVTDAAAVSFLPMATGTPSAVYRVDGQDYPADQPPPSANFQLVVGDYHDALRVPLRGGRWFNTSDIPGGPVVGVINETLAREAFGQDDPLGRGMTMFGGVQFEVIGVVGDTRQRLPGEPPAPEAMFAYRQVPFWPGMFLAVRSTGAPPDAGTLRSVVWDLDATLPVSDVRAMDDVVTRASRQQRAFAAVVATFAFLAAGLGAIGIFALVSHAVSSRMPEFGLRLALGATRRQLLTHAMANSLAPCVVGVALGTLAATWLSRMLGSQLFGVAPHDALTFIAVPLSILAVSALASYLPARRATRADASSVLRPGG